MLMALIGFCLFALVYVALWSCWCRYAGAFMAPSTPSWIRQPNFWLFFFVSVLFVVVYKNAAKR